MDIDKLFKVPKLPTGSNKRRMPDAPTPEMLKKMRMDTEAESSSSHITNGASTQRPMKVTVRDEEEEEAELMDQDFAPGGDSDYFAEEDDEGRFYGGGLTSEQKEILNIFDKAGDDSGEVQSLSAVGVRRLLGRLDKAAKRNSDQRSKYPNDPTKFIDSEADLDGAIKSLLPLAQVPKVAYPELVRSGQVETLVGLLSHENTDIALDIVELIHELTDEDVGGEDENDGEDEDPEDREAALKTLVIALLNHSILELLVDNMTRFNEAEEADRQGIFHVLGIFENIVGSNPTLAERLILKTKLLPWILRRIEFNAHDENRGYAAELLSILLQGSRPNRLELGKRDGIETLLKVASQFRRRDPVDADETEFMENIFDSLCSALGEPEVKELFLKSEGVDLMILIMKEKMQSRSRSIKTLDHAMSGQAGTEACEVFVEASGLKHLFSAFMGKGSKKQKGVAAPPASEDTTHVLGIVSSLLSNLPSDSSVRTRLLTKFVENTYEKTDKLLDIRATAQARLATVDKEIEAERKGLKMDGEEIGQDEDYAWYLKRLEGGLYTLQTVDYILAWIVMEDDGICAHAKQMLDRRSISFKEIVATLRVYRDNIDESEPKEGDAPGAIPQRDILHHLIDFLDSC